MVNVIKTSMVSFKFQITNDYTKYLIFILVFILNIIEQQEKVNLNS